MANEYRDRSRSRDDPPRLLTLTEVEVDRMHSFSQMCSNPRAIHAQQGQRDVLDAPAPPGRAHQMLACFWCSETNPFVAKNSKGLLIHITSQHQGAAMGPLHARQLQFHNKRVCEGCGALRAGTSRQCHIRCGGSNTMRDARAGDIIKMLTTTEAKRQYWNCMSIV